MDAILRQVSTLRRVAHATSAVLCRVAPAPGGLDPEGDNLNDADGIIRRISRLDAWAKVRAGKPRVVVVPVPPTHATRANWLAWYGWYGAVSWHGVAMCTAQMAHMEVMRLREAHANSSKRASGLQASFTFALWD